MSAKQAEHLRIVADNLSQLLDGETIDDTVHVLLCALTFAIHQGGDTLEERLEIYERFTEALLNDLVEMSQEEGMPKSDHTH